MLGIPYAKPPVGSLRFAKPKPFGGFGTKKRNATVYGSACLQQTARPGVAVIGSEDCLSLNIYTANSQHKKVSFFKHAVVS